MVNDNRLNDCLGFYVNNPVMGISKPAATTTAPTTTTTATTTTAAAAATTTTNNNNNNYYYYYFGDEVDDGHVFERSISEKRLTTFYRYIFGLDAKEINQCCKPLLLSGSSRGDVFLVAETWNLIILETAAITANGE